MSRGFAPLAAPAALAVDGFSASRAFLGARAANETPLTGALVRLVAAGGASCVTRAVCGGATRSAVGSLAGRVAVSDCLFPADSCAVGYPQANRAGLLPELQSHFARSG
jgi:hypothetical protein